jgi:hypothetical protein
VDVVDVAGVPTTAGGRAAARIEAAVTADATAR